jgi:plasmid stability protein
MRYICYTILKRKIMATAITRTQTSFRLSDELIEKLRIEAKKHNRSLNNLVESVLMAFVSHKPNETTLAAMREAENSDNLETLDLKNFRSFVESL